MDRAIGRVFRAHSLQALTATVLLFLAAGGLAGQEDGLYGSGAPDDAAFVRLVNVGGNGNASTSIGGTELGPVPPADASPYRPVAVGLFSVRVGGRSAELIAENAAYYTVALTDDELMIFEDPEHTDATAAQVFLYNLGSQAGLRIVTTERGTNVTGLVAPGESTQVTVNPVAVHLTLSSEAAELEALGDPGLERGESYSFFAFDRDDTVDAFVTLARVATE